jgi:tetratricopeptide (TPR) repeat protein
LIDQDRLLVEKYVNHASGWLELGKLKEAEMALSKVPAKYRLTIPVLNVRVAICLATERWEVAEGFAGVLTKMEPDEPDHWVSLACAKRRTRSVAVAEKVLLRAREKFPDCAAIFFNLACYSSLQGNFDLVADLLEKASELDPDFEKLALEDPDLEPYWRSLGLQTPF